MLKVKITGIIGEGATKAMRFEPQTTVREALRILAAKSNLREADMIDLEEQYVIFKPKTEFDGTILDNYSSYLIANDLNDNDVIEFKRRPYPIRVKTTPGKEESFMVDFMAPTSQIILHICAKYGYSTPEKYRLYHDKNPDVALSPHLSLNEQDVPREAVITISKEKKNNIFSQIGRQVRNSGQSVIIRGERVLGGSQIGDHSRHGAPPGAPLLFGAPLASALKGQPVPPFMKQCFDYIREKALDKEGIFRLSGSAVEINRLKEAFNRGDEPNLRDCMDCHVVCGLLKQYLRELPEPLLTYELYDTMMDQYNKPPEELNKLLMKVPEINRVVLRELLRFLSEVVSCSASNKMPIHNVATVFAPNLLRMRDENIMRIVQDTPKINTITATLILHHELFFPKDAGGAPPLSPSSNRVGFNSPAGTSAGPAKPPTPSSSGNLSNSGDGKAITSKNGEYLCYVRVAFDYDSQNDQELTLRVGEVIGVLQEHESGWWKGEKRGVIGLFPVTYCEECDKPLGTGELQSVIDKDAPAASLIAMATNGDPPPTTRRGMVSEYVGARGSPVPGRFGGNPRTPGAGLKDDSGIGKTSTGMTPPTELRKPGMSYRAKPPPPARTKSAVNMKSELGAKDAPSATDDSQMLQTSVSSPDLSPQLRPLNRVPPPIPYKPPNPTLAREPQAPSPLSQRRAPPALPAQSTKPTSNGRAGKTSDPPAPQPDVVKAEASSNGGDATKQLDEKAKHDELEKMVAFLREEIAQLKARQTGGKSSSPSSDSVEKELAALRQEVVEERKAKEELQKLNAGLLEEIVKLRGTQPSRPAAPPAATPKTSTAGSVHRRPTPLGGSSKPAPAGAKAESGDVEAQLAEALKKLGEEAEARKAFESKILEQLAALKNP